MTTHVANASELWDDELFACRVGSDPVFVVKRGACVVAYRDRCPHLGVPLSEGMLDGDVLTCRAHHHTFDVTTGRGINPPDAQLDRFVARIDVDADAILVAART